MKRSTWRFVLEIVGASLTLAGAVCLVIGFWDMLTGCCRHTASEYADYDDDQLYE